MSDTAVKVLVIFAHPSRASHLGSLLELVLDRLKLAQAEIEIADLYVEQFDPVLSAGEFHHYTDLNAAPAEVRHHMQRLERAEGLILIYPTWWYSMPAILNGYFDRAWLPGHSFVLENGVSRGLLSKLRRVLAITTYGGAEPFIAGEIGDPGRVFFERGLKRLFDPSCETRWCAEYGMDLTTPERLAAFRARVLHEADFFR